MLNARFENGHPSNDLAEAGVLLRMFDNLGGSIVGVPWLPCPIGSWCEEFRNRWPSSIVNKHVRKLYGLTASGMVLAPTVGFFCVTPGDGNSMGNGPDGCYEDDCDLHGPRDWNCKFTPSHLKEALEAQQRRWNGDAGEHNEVVVDVSTVTPLLPHVIMAWFYMDDAGVARRAHQEFIHTYRLDEDDCPLVHLNLYDREKPAFRLLRSGE